MKAETMLCFYMLRNIRMPVTSRSWSMSHSGRVPHQTRQEVTLTATTSDLQLPETLMAKQYISAIQATRLWPFMPTS